MREPNALSSSIEKNKFSSLEGEARHLVEMSSKKEERLLKSFERVDRESIIREEVRRYAKAHPDEILEKGYKMLHKEAHEITLKLSPETHDKKIEELLSILQERGIRNTLHVISLMQNPHIEDDFHRFLVQYIKEGLPIIDEKSAKEIVKSAKYTLFEVSFPDEKNEDNKQKPLKELLSSMEQFFGGMLSEGLKDEGETFTIELCNPEGTLESVFYVSVPDTKTMLFEKQMLAVFPKARIFEKKDDYNIFNYDGVSLGASAKSGDNPIYPIKTYDVFDYDPLNLILNSFSKIERDGEGASFQIVLKPDKEGYMGNYKEALRNLENGASLKEATNVKHSIMGEISKVAKGVIGGGLRDMILGEQTFSKENNERFIEEIKKKVSTPISHAQIRLIASAKSRDRAEAILRDITSSFSQFENSLGNKLSWDYVSDKNLGGFLRDFSYRNFIKEESLPLSLREITSLFHFPMESTSMPHLKSARSASAPAPIGLPEDGILLGVNHDRNIHTKIFIESDDRMRHMYVIGQTGTGKSTLLKNMIIQDIKNGEGVCMIDPHGSDIQEILAHIPLERADDLIYFDPGYAIRPMALNMLEFDPNFPEQKTFVVNELLSIFNKLFDMKTAGGPMFEQYFRNSVLLAMEDPETGNTLLDVSRILANKQFRDLKLSRCKNPIVVQFWQEIASKAGGEASLSNIVPYITSKFDVFLTNDIMRPIVSQEKSSFNFRKIMDEKKILLVNLSKGRLGDINANLIGLVLVGKILMSALSRVDSFGKDLPPFYLYIDEFQNITTNSIAQILSEARKYKLSLTIAHQFIAQLEDDIKDAVFGNVGTISAFRVGAEDAEYLVKQFEPVFEERDLINLDNRNAYMKLLVGGRPVRPFSMETLPVLKGDIAMAEKLKNLSYEKFGRLRAEVEDEIMKKYRKEPVPEAPKTISPFL